jgi:hypothetical protein
MVLLARVLLFGLTLAVVAYASVGRLRVRRPARIAARPRFVVLRGGAEFEPFHRAVR